MMDQALLDEMKRKDLAKVMAMPVVGNGRFNWCGNVHELPIVKNGKRDITLRSADGTLITLNKKFVEVL